MAYRSREVTTSLRSKRPQAAAPTAPSTSQLRRLMYIAVAAILAWYWGSAVTAIVDKSTTFDELFHLTAGYSYWTLGDYRMQPENGNLPQRWAAIPLLFGKTQFPSTGQEAWRGSMMGMIGDQFFYDRDKVGNDADVMLLRGRAMIALFGVALGAVIFFWTRSLLGAGAGFFSLVLFAFCPTMLTNGALVTSDMCAGLFFVASMGCIWRVLHRLTWQTLAVSSLVMAGLFVAKFSASMIVPMGLLLMLIQLISRQPTVIVWKDKVWEVQLRRWRLPVQLATIAAHVVVVWVVIWAFYGFRYDMFASTTTAVDQQGNTVVVDRPAVPWESLLKNDSFVDHAIVAMREARFLPESYLYGFAHTWSFAQKRSAFLNGKYSIEGWPQFFPYCLMVKTPLTLFALMGLAAAAIARNWYLAGATWRPRARAMFTSLYRTSPIWVLFVVYWAFAIPSHLNIGHRHILPTYPAMLMFAGASTLWLAKRERSAEREEGKQRSKKRKETQSLEAFRYEIPSHEKPQSLKEGVKLRPPRWIVSRRWPVQAVVVLLLILLFVTESVLCWPNYLPYFNQLIGSRSNAFRHLVDSSLDWGQDLPGLKAWLVKEGLDSSLTEKVYLSYFGTGSPEYYGIKATLLPCFADRTPSRIPDPLLQGTYCISATMLENVYTMFPGPWTRTYEAHYQQLLSNMRAFDATPSGSEARSRLVAQGGQQNWINAFRQYEHARLARLTSVLRGREPDAEINYSILVYRLTNSELSRALEGPPVEIEEPKSESTAQQ